MMGHESKKGAQMTISSDECTSRDVMSQLNVMLLLESNIPLRKAMEETCAQAVARKLRMQRSEPGGTSDWSGCGSIEGFNNAAALCEY